MCAPRAQEDGWHWAFRFGDQHADVTSQKLKEGNISKNEW